MDAIEYELHMRKFVNALQPMHEFFLAEAACDEQPFTGLNYRLLCGAIAGNIADLEYRLQERAGRDRFGDEAFVKARAAADGIQAEEEEDAAPVTPKDAL